jgi:hypothetical protein
VVAFVGLVVGVVCGVAAVAVAVESGLRQSPDNGFSAVEKLNRQGCVGSAGYWVVVVVLVAFGTITGFSIGLPFLLIGLTLAVVGPFRKRTVVFWPVVIAVLAFIGGFGAVAPISCSTTSSSAASGQAASNTRCTNLVGIDYSGPRTYNPSLVPALTSGLFAAVTPGFLSRVWLRRRQAADHPGRHRADRYGHSAVSSTSRRFENRVKRH